MPRIKQETPKIEVWPNATKNDRWRDIIAQALIYFGKTAQLFLLYELIEEHPRTRGLKHWKAKVRQQLQASPLFVRVGPGVWSLASEHSAAKVKRFEKLRRERHPLKTDRES